MKRLLDTENKGALTDKTWLHTGEDGRDKITIETVQDVEPVFKRARQLAQAGVDKDFRFAGSIPLNVVNEIAKTAGQNWGVSTADAYREFMSSKTDRSKKIWKMLLQSRDYRKLQARHYV